MLNKIKIITSVSALAMLLGTSAQAQIGEAGRQLDEIRSEITGSVDFFGTPFATRDLVGIRWDPRCSSVEYTFNSDAAANAGTGADISPTVLAATVQTGLDRWNDNPSSYIEMNITNLSPLGLRARGFDFINEVTFFTPPGFGALASSPSVSLTADSTFNAGDDLDGDGDSDVYDPAAAGVNVCTDIDNDGDIEFPAGFYAAGTILENDVQFGSGVFWELNATDFGGADVDAVSTHEFGHSHGLSHALNNQTSATDGTGTTMFPFIATDEGASELATREPHADDLAHSALIYQEGSGTGPAALQAGDVAFDSAYDLVTGSVSSIEGDTLVPRAGANVRVTDFFTGEFLGEGFAGETTIIDIDGNPATGDLAVIPANNINGDFVVPVLRAPRRSITATIQAPDGSPAGPGGFSTLVTAANIANGLDFVQENYSGAFGNESNREFGRSDLSVPVRPRNGVAANIDFITNDVEVLRNGGPQTFAGLGLGGASSVTYVERFDTEDVLATLEDNRLTGFAFVSNTFDDDLVPMFDNATLYVGETAPDGTISFISELGGATDVVARDADFTVVTVNAVSLDRILPRLARTTRNLDLFVVLEDNETVLDRVGFPSTQMGLDQSGTGTSFVSSSGGPLLPAPFAITWNVELRYEPR